MTPLLMLVPKLVNISTGNAQTQTYSAFCNVVDLELVSTG